MDYEDQGNIVSRAATTAPKDNGGSANPAVTFDDVERVLAVGRLLLSVLTPEELDRLRDDFAAARPPVTMPVALRYK